MKISAIILAAGSGSRTGLKINKVLYEIKGRKVIDFALDSLKRYSIIDEIIFVVSENDFNYFENEYKDRVDLIVIGGRERQDSVYKALNKAKNEIVLIHDGARPYIPEHSMREIIDNLGVEDVMTLGVPVKDTIQEIAGNRVVKTLKRSSLIATQTPQVFKKQLLLDSHNLALKDRFIGTDDTSLVEKYFKKQAFVIKGDYRNLKLTTLDDIKLLEVILWSELETVLIYTGWKRDTD